MLISPNDISQTDMLRYKFCCGKCINRIRQMIGINNDGIFANQIQGKAERIDIALINVREWSALEGVTKNDLIFSSVL